MKKLLPNAVLVFFIFLQYQVFAQYDTLHLDKAKASEMFFQDSTYAPRIFLSSISDNILTNKLTVDLEEKEVKINGVVYGKEDSRCIGNLIFSGSNQDNTSTLFSKKNVAPKISLEFLNSTTVRSWISYNSNVPLILDSLLKHPEKRKRNNYWSFSQGVKIESSKYNIIDTIQKFDNLYSEKYYLGIIPYVQFNALSYSYKKEKVYSTAIRVEYGYVNNVDDLDEYTITDSYQYSSGNSFKRFELGKTGLMKSDYQLQNKIKLVGEFGSYGLNKNSRLGWILGTDFTYAEKESNLFTLYGGPNFPIRNGDKDIVFISLLCRTSDPFKFNTYTDFSIGKTISVFLRAGIPLNFETKKESNE